MVITQGIEFHPVISIRLSLLFECIAQDEWDIGHLVKKPSRPKVTLERTQY